MIADRNRTKCVLPESVSDTFRTLAIEMRKRPFPITRGGEDFLSVSDGLATVINPGDAEILEEGMMFTLCRKVISGKKIIVKALKYRGSGNHHKFLVIVHDGAIAGGAM